MKHIAITLEYYLEQALSEEIGLVFFIVAWKIKAGKLRDYLTIAGIGDTIVGIALSTSALQQPYGVAAHSLVLLSSYLFCMGMYVSAIAVSQDNSLRKAIKKSIPVLFDNVGSAQTEKELLASSETAENKSRGDGGRNWRCFLCSD